MKKITKIAALCIGIAIVLGIIWHEHGVHTSPFDGSVSIAKKYLKEHLDDASSYESVEWGKLTDDGDGTYEIYHRYRAKNAFGALVIGEVVFDLSSDGEQVLSIKDENGWHETYPGAVDEYRQKYYQQSDFKDHQFNGVLTETIDGLNEEFQVNATFTKNGSKIRGNIIAAEKNVTYELKGEQSELGKFDCKLKNTSNNEVAQISVSVTYKGLEGASSDGNQISFKLSENN